LSDGWRDVVSTLGEIEPPMDLWADVLAREAGIPPSRSWWTRPHRTLVVALAIAGCVTVVGLLVIAAHSHSRPAPAGGHRSGMTLGQAIAVARKDGFRVTGSSARLRCGSDGFIMGDEPMSESPGGLGASVYVISVTDGRLAAHTAPNGFVDRPSLTLAMLDSPLQARTCAEQGIAPPPNAREVLSPPSRLPEWRMFSPITVEDDYYPSVPNVTRATSAFYTFLARGRLLAEGQGYTRHQAAIVESDLRRLARQIARGSATSAP